jgi:putative intracellular protease/amidase
MALSESLKSAKRTRHPSQTLVGIPLAAGLVAGIVAVGVFTSRRGNRPRVEHGDSAEKGLPPRLVTDGQVVVAVMLGTSGSVATNALAPYEVFSRSPAFSVYTASAAHATAVLSSGLSVVPDYSLQDVDEGLAPEPDVVVVPAVVAPKSRTEAALRDWIVRRADRGALILGVCAGSILLAQTGLLDGRRATSHWSNVGSLQRHHPQVDWVQGERYVEDGAIITTGGVTSGVFGALRVVELLAGREEAEKLGRALAYPGWVLDRPSGMPVQRIAPSDASYALNLAFPWFRPTVAVGLVEGVAEIDVAGAFEIYAGNSFAARAIPIAAARTTRTERGLSLVARLADAHAPHVDRFVVPGVRTIDGVDAELLRWGRRPRPRR